VPQACHHERIELKVDAATFAASDRLAALPSSTFTLNTASASGSAPVTISINTDS
jgi:hypothetical protein